MTLGRGEMPILGSEVIFCLLYKYLVNGNTPTRLIRESHLPKVCKIIHMVDTCIFWNRDTLPRETGVIFLWLVVLHLTFFLTLSLSSGLKGTSLTTRTISGLTVNRETPNSLLEILFSKNTGRRTEKWTYFWHSVKTVIHIRVIKYKNRTFVCILNI